MVFIWKKYFLMNAEPEFTDETRAIGCAFDNINFVLYILTYKPCKLN